MEKKLAPPPDGEEEEVIADERQMLNLLVSIHTGEANDKKE